MPTITSGFNIGPIFRLGLFVKPWFMRLWLGFHLDASDKLSRIPTLHDNQIVCKTTAHKVLAIFADLMNGVSARVSPVAKRAQGPVLRAQV